MCYLVLTVDCKFDSCDDGNDAQNHRERSQPTAIENQLMTDVRTHASARGDLLAFLKSSSSGFRPHPLEVFCPSPKHCWVDVAAVKGPDLWAFEYTIPRSVDVSVNAMLA